MQDRIENRKTSSDEIDIRELFLVLRSRKKLIYSIVFVGVALSILLTFFIKKPIYEVRSMIEIGSFYNMESHRSILLGNIKDTKQKLSYMYKVDAKGISRPLPYLSTIDILEESEDIFSLVVYAKNNEDGKKYMQQIVDKILSDSNEKIVIHLANSKSQINDKSEEIKNYETYLKQINKNIDTTKEKIKILSKADPALAGISVLEISKKDSLLIEITNEISKLKEEVSKLNNSISAGNVKYTKMIGEIELQERPISPKKLKTIMIAFFVSLLFSIFLVFFLSFLKGLKEEDV